MAKNIVEDYRRLQAARRRFRALKRYIEEAYVLLEPFNITVELIHQGPGGYAGLSFDEVEEILRDPDAFEAQAMEAAKQEQDRIEAWRKRQKQLTCRHVEPKYRRHCTRLVRAMNGLSFAEAMPEDYNPELPEWCYCDKHLS
jgi:hypothetical protein